MHAYPNSRGLAIVAGIAATGGALAILLGDPIMTGGWRLDHGLLPIIVGITIAAGHLAKSALTSRKPGSSLGFAFIFILGTILTVYSSVGSQKAAVGDKASTIEAHNAAIKSKTGEIASAKTRLEQANAMAEKEMTGQRCGPRCNDWKKRAGEVDSHVRILEAELARMGGTKASRPKAEGLVELLAIFGFDKAKVAHVATILEPFGYSLLLEITAIVAFGYGFQPRARIATIANSQPAAQAPAKPPRKRISGNGQRGRKRDPKVISFVDKFREKNGRNPSGSELIAAFPGIPKSTAYDATKAA